MAEQYKAPIGAHPASDKSTVIKGLAGFEVKGPVGPWAYHPRVLGEDDVEIKISHCGICGSDIHSLDSGWFPTTYPVICGHEIVGEVTHVGANVKNVKLGERVGVGAACKSCLKCDECKKGEDPHCTKGLWTYNSKHEDGQMTYGGYADAVRVHSQWCFPIPENLTSEVVAPLLCAGATVYAPLARAKIGKGHKVAVIGIGGLGHLGVQFAHKLGAEVTAVSSSDKKKADATKLGAAHYINSSNEAEIKAAFRAFDYILLTAPHGNDKNLESYFSMVKVGGTFCTVALPEEPFKFSPWSIFGNRVNFTTSSIGSRDEIKEMLAFASKHDVHPWVEVLPMDKANEGIQKVRDNNVKFRVVLKN